MTADPAPPADQRLLLDHYLPSYDVVVRAHRVVEADTQASWRALRGFDLMRVRSPLISAAFAVRGLPQQVSRLLGRQTGPPPKEIEHLWLDEGLPGWVKLGENSGREFAFGAVGVFWTPNITWREVAAQDFAAFSAPGYGKIACDLSVQPYGGNRSIISYECRTATTDDESRRKFRRYWGVVKPFVSHIMQATVDTIGRDADRLRAQ